MEPPCWLSQPYPTKLPLPLPHLEKSGYAPVTEMQCIPTLTSGSTRKAFGLGIPFMEDLYPTFLSPCQKIKDLDICPLRYAFCSFMPPHMNTQNSSAITNAEQHKGYGYEILLEPKFGQQICWKKFGQHSNLVSRSVKKVIQVNAQCSSPSP